MSGLETIAMIALPVAAVAAIVYSQSKPSGEPPAIYPRGGVTPPPAGGGSGTKDGILGLPDVPATPSTLPDLTGYAWRGVKTDASAVAPETKAALAIGARVTATLQQAGHVDLADDAEMVVVDGTLVVTRTPTGPKDLAYTLQVGKVLRTNKLTVAPPTPGTLVQISPDQVRSVEPVASTSTTGVGWTARPLVARRAPSTFHDARRR